MGQLGYSLSVANRSTATPVEKERDLPSVIVCNCYDLLLVTTLLLVMLLEFQITAIFLVLVLE